MKKLRIWIAKNSSKIAMCFGMLGLLLPMEILVIGISLHMSDRESIIMIVPAMFIMFSGFTIILSLENIIKKWPESKILEALGIIKRFPETERILQLLIVNYDIIKLGQWLEDYQHLMNLQQQLRDKKEGLKKLPLETKELQEKIEKLLKKIGLQEKE